MSEVAQLCPTLCDPMDCSLSGSSIHGIFQARVLEWIAISMVKNVRTTNECHSNEHHQNLVSGDKISQDNSKEPTQLDRDCTPKQTGYRSSDSWTRRDLSHAGDVNLELANAPTSPCSENAMAPHSSTLAWKIPWMEEPDRLQSMGSLGVGYDWATALSLFTFMHWRRKWQPTPVFLPGESQGRGSLVGCRLWGHTESDTTEAT